MIRHAKAARSLCSSIGDEKSLVEQGIEQAIAMGCFLKQEGHKIDLVLTSPILRAKQTTDQLCKYMNVGGPVIAPWLAPGMRPEIAMSELKVYTELDSVAIVGHEPDLSHLICHLLKRSKPPYEIKKASVTVLNFERGINANVNFEFWSTF